MKKKFSCLLLAGLVAIGLTGCAGKPRFLKDNEINGDVGKVNGTIRIAYTYDKETTEQTVDIPFVLDYDKAPNTVANFYKAAKEGKYDDLLVNQPASASDKSGVILGQKHFTFDKDEDGKDLDTIDYTTAVAFDPEYHIVGEMAKHDWTKNDNEMKGDGYLSMVLEDENDYNSAAMAFGVTMISDDKKSDGTYKTNSFGKTHCIFGALQAGENHGFFSDIAQSPAGYVFSGEHAMRIAGITFDKDYNLKALQF